MFAMSIQYIHILYTQYFDLIYKVETYIIVWLAWMDDWLSPWFLLNDGHRHHHQQQLHHYHRRGSQSQT